MLHILKTERLLYTPRRTRLPRYPPSLAVW